MREKELLERIEALESRVEELEDRISDLEQIPPPIGNKYDEIDFPGIVEETQNREKPLFFKSQKEAMAVRDKLENEGKGDKLMILDEDENKWIVTDDRGKGVVVLCEDGEFRPYSSHR